MEKDKPGKVIAQGGGSLLKIEQTILPPKSWYGIIQALDEMPVDEMMEFISFLVRREKDRTGSLDFTGISQENGAIKALRQYDDELRKTGRKKGGATTAEGRKREADDKAREVQRERDKLNVPDHNKAAILAQRFGYPVRTIRNLMKRKLPKQE